MVLKMGFVEITSIHSPEHSSNGIKQKRAFPWILEGIASSTQHSRANISAQWWGVNTRESLPSSRVEQKRNIVVGILNARGNWVFNRKCIFHLSVLGRNLSLRDADEGCINGKITELKMTVFNLPVIAGFNWKSFPGSCFHRDVKLQTFYFLCGVATVSGMVGSRHIFL